METVDLAAFRARSAKFGNPTTEQRLAEIERRLNEFDALLSPEPALGKILDAVCEFYKVGIRDIRGESRCKTIVLPRHVAAYLCRQLAACSLPKIGRFMRRDPTTVLESVKKIEERRKLNSKLDANIDRLIQIIGGK